MQQVMLQALVVTASLTGVISVLSILPIRLFPLDVGFLGRQTMDRIFMVSLSVQIAHIAALFGVTLTMTPGSPNEHLLVLVTVVIVSGIIQLDIVGVVLFALYHRGVLGRYSADDGLKNARCFR